MNDFAAWQRSNDEYLGAALAWLRLRLERMAPREQTPARAWSPMPVPQGPSMWDRVLGRRPPSGAYPRPALLPPASAASQDHDVAQAASALERIAASDPPPALVILSRRFGLSLFEQNVLLLSVAMELDTRMASLCARAQDDPNRPYPTFALGLALFDDPAWDVLSPERPLRYWRLLEIGQTTSQPLTATALRADERIANYIKGLNYLDDRLSPIVTPMEPLASGFSLPPSGQAAVDSIVRGLEQRGRTDRLPVVQLLGPDGPSKQLVATGTAAVLGLQLYRLPAELLPGQASETETLARLWQRETVLLPIALYVDQQEVEGGAGDAHAVALDRFLTRNNGVCFLASRDLRPGIGPATLAVDVAKPSAGEQREAWGSLLGTHAGESPSRLSAQFDLNLAAIHRITQSALDDPPEAGAAMHQRLWAACLASTRPRLDVLAQRIDARATWDDLVLPPSEIALLKQVAAQVAQRSRVYEDWGFARKMNRGLGISALFSGESGTGKTMAAEVIANDLCLSLYRIDLSAVVSKYIGETEKNLRRLFDAAEDGGAILFFDEADAIFGKRSEVKDSHDRYANIEINYLLQRMESYRGLAILATNMRSALDRAFLRRLRFTVDFPFPGPAERRLIWQKVFPAETETSGLDLSRLARLNLTGGSIHNIALNAAFLAAGAGQPVTMSHVLDAARAEFRKLERPVNEAEFRWLEPSGVVA
jgi:ATPase family protein associated with various cellular activities (AAA)/winged helix domain-containing protein